MQSGKTLLPPKRFAPHELLAPGQALVAFLSRVALAPPAAERVLLQRAFGRILACDVAADDDHPACARSAMDGFAIAAVRAPNAFRIAGEVRMGGLAPAIGPDETVRIPTGGALPSGADAVVAVEEVREMQTHARIERSVEPGENVIEAGSDMRRGERVLRAGERIGAAQLGVLATLGICSVPVRRRPVVAILSTGDELVEPSARPSPGQVRDSNRYAIGAAVEAIGARARGYPRAGDEAGALEAALERALRECDAVAVTGGSSVGERDRLPAAVAALGDPGIVVHGLRVKPGKPTLLGASGGKPILGLPGNPTSALMMLEAVGVPVIAALMGAQLRRPVCYARLAAPVRGRPGWTWYVPVRLENDAELPVAHPLPLRSFSVSLLARAEGYLAVGEHGGELPAGALVRVHRFMGG
jgi:molybdenum cofactor synthesis domain-containing protein